MDDPIRFLSLVSGTSKFIQAIQQHKRQISVRLFGICSSKRSNVVSKPRRRSKSGKLAFVDKVCDLSMRGDIDGVTELLKSFWSDKSKHPWNKIHSSIVKYWQAATPGDDVSESLIKIRDAVFGALDIHSLSLALETTTDGILDILLKGKDWKEGRKKARTFCSKAVGDLISKGQLDYLDSSSLQRDGFGYLIGSLEQAKLEQYRNAKPVESKGKLDVKSLSRSVQGRMLMRELGVVEVALDAKDPRAQGIVRAYEDRLIELETDTSKSFEQIGPVEQLTLNGEPVEGIAGKEEEKKGKSQKKDTHQVELTEYISGKRASRARTKRRNSKKTATDSKRRRR